MNWNKLKRESIRSGVLLVVGLLVLQPDLTTWQALSYVAGLCFLLFAVAHYARKALFPGIDTYTLAEDALHKGNLASALVFASICLVLCSLLFILSGPLLRGIS